jgi:serine/threonine protein phosphatase 1
VAVGDIHGRLDLLEPLIVRIKAEVAGANGPTAPMLVFLGDYVDRGPNSRGVIARIIDLERDPGLEVRALKGNHEEAMLAFLNDAAAGPAWSEQGGAQTLVSYGVSPPPRTDDTAWRRARDDFAEALPADHLDFLTRLELSVVCGDYVFVHAGLRPGVPLSAQSERDLLWIRQDFLSSTQPFDKVVVHGHTPETEPFLGTHRIGVDTGAYATGLLTAVWLRGAEHKMIQSRLERSCGSSR